MYTHNRLFFRRAARAPPVSEVGEGERQLRDLFDEAQRAQPAVIFLDEVAGRGEDEICHTIKGNNTVIL